eukprot:g33426.t1
MIVVMLGSSYKEQLRLLDLYLMEFTKMSSGQAGKCSGSGVADESGINASPDSSSINVQPRAVIFWKGPIRFLLLLSLHSVCRLLRFIGCLIGLAADILGFVEEFPEPHLTDAFLGVCLLTNGHHFGRAWRCLEVMVQRTVISHFPFAVSISFSSLIYNCWE